MKVLYAILVGLGVTLLTPLLTQNVLSAPYRTSTPSSFLEATSDLTDAFKQITQIMKKGSIDTDDFVTINKLSYTIEGSMDYLTKAGMRAGFYDMEGLAKAVEAIQIATENQQLDATHEAYKNLASFLTNK